MAIAIRKDDAIPGMFLRQLEDIEAQAQRVEFAELSFADGKVLPLDIQNKPGYRTTTYRQVTRIGVFGLMRSYNTNIPSINILTEEFTQQIHKWAGQYYFSDDDVDAAKVTDFPLEVEEISAVREAAMQEMNKLMATGSEVLRMPGLLNHPDVLRSYSPVRFNSTATPAQILTTLNDAVSSVVTLTKRVEQPDTLFLPTTQYDYVSTTNRSDGVDRTILEQFLSASPYIKNVEPLIECDGAGPNGEDVALIMRRDRRKLKAMIYEDFKFLDLQRQGLGYQRPACFRYAGIRLYRPYSVHLLINV
ncbi:MAG: major capsid family protein [Cyanobacteria bacterium P01_F01_bin.3]